MSTDDAWWRDGICAEIGSDLFFVDTNHPIHEAKRACAICPVRLQCLTDVLENHVEYGVFGGFGRDTRRQLAASVAAGENPVTVAKRAIAADTRKTNGRTKSAGDRDRVRPRRARPPLRPAAG